VTVPNPSRRIAIAREALELSSKLKPSEDRLIVQSMLTRRLYQYGDPAAAAAAARMLQDTFTQLYNCDSAACTAIRLDSNPGEAVNDFAEYITEHKIRPADLTLTHPSLDARVLILDLSTALNGHKPKFNFFSTPARMPESSKPENSKDDPAAEEHR
jgi:hypothetical protein